MKRAMNGDGDDDDDDYHMDNSPLGSSPKKRAETNAERKAKKKPKSEAMVIEEEEEDEEQMMREMSDMDERNISDDDDVKPSTSALHANARRAQTADTPVNPVEMTKYLQSLSSFQPGTVVKAFHAFGKAGEMPPNQDGDSMKIEFFRYLKAAMQRDKLTMPSAVRLIQDYLNDPKSVEMFADFPKDRPSKMPLTMYLALEGARMARENKVIFKDRLKKIHDKWAASKTIQASITEQWEKAQLEFANKLDQFLARHREVRERMDWVQHVNQLKFEAKKLVANCQNKASNPAARKNGKVGKTMPMKPKTAFEYFLQTKKDKYPELTAEEREKKLLKRFNKLDSDQREIFDALAANQ